MVVTAYRPHGNDIRRERKCFQNWQKVIERLEAEVDDGIDMYRFTRNSL